MMEQPEPLGVFLPELYPYCGLKHFAFFFSYRDVTLFHPCVIYQVGKLEPTKHTISDSQGARW